MSLDEQTRSRLQGIARTRPGDIVPAVCGAMLAMIVTVTSSPAADVVLVRDGAPNAEIVIAPNPPRTVALAATELQTHVAKMSGATLPIVRAPGSAPVKVFVGRSEHTDRLKLDERPKPDEQMTGELKHGAFRIVAGDDRVVLLGHDADFVPPKFFLKSGGDLPRFLVDEWDKATGEIWGFANGNLYKEYHAELKIWERDERGSMNAVYELLRRLGVRWFWPGELGEEIPTRKTISVAATNETVRPDFALRYPYQYMRMFGHEGTTRDEALWQLRMGWNLAPDLIGDFGMGLSHGMNPIYERKEVRAAHPEYYALYGGRRDELKVGEARPCLSSPGLFAQNVKYVRTMFDLLDAPLVSVMPQDGYVNLCQCPLCEGKGTLDRGWNGQISDYVWSHVDRVAREAAKTHPDRKVCCYAYGAYLMPPEKIRTLSPNVLVGICQNRNLFHDPVERKKFEALRAAWLEKLPEGSRRFVINDYYLQMRPFTQPHLPVYFPRAIAHDLKSLKGISIGDFIEVYRDPKGVASLAVDHLNLYVTSRCWWDASQSVDALLDDYYTTCFGPARDEMKAFVEASEAAMEGMGKDAAKLGTLIDLLARAEKKADPATIYGKRVAFVSDYLRPMKDLREQLARGRGDVPEARAHDRAKSDIVLDGKLDDEFWKGTTPHNLVELQTGREPDLGTSFRVAWADGAVYFGIRCAERKVSPVNIGTRKDEDPNLWNGDCVEILFETQGHSYYQLAVNPAGALIDLDRKKDLDTLWSSGAQAACHVADDHWTAEIRIPVAGERQEEIDPRNGVSGRKPSVTYPWYVNVCRQRVRPKESEHSAFNPTGTATFHDVKKFGKLVVR